MEPAYYLKKLREDFSKRQRANRAYSLRAYARDLGMPASTLSQVLLGNRPLPLKCTSRVVERIRLNARERTLFTDSLGKKHVLLDQIRLSASDDRFILDETYYQIIAEWEHYAALMLFDCDRFPRTEEAIRGRLGLTRLRSQVVVGNLLKFGMLSRDPGGKLERTHPRFRTTEDVASQALRASHRESLEIAQKKLEDVAVELRDFSSMTMAVDPRRIPEAKAVIREFRQKLFELLKAGKRTEVYQVAIQFYPMTAPVSGASKGDEG
jgi:uncharacterized protein (TIGR02147 family)